MTDISVRACWRDFGLLQRQEQRESAREEEERQKKNREGARGESAKQRQSDRE